MPLQKLVNYPVTTNFRFHCQELPLLSELAQDVTIPALTISPAEVQTRFVDYGQPGEKIIFAEMDVGFSMDEYLDVYAEIYSWMQRLGGPPGLSSVEESDREALTADLEVLMLDNAMRQSRKFIFHDAWPTTIGAITLDQAGEATPIKGIVTFEYMAMTISPADKNLTQLGDLRYNH